MHDVFFSLSPLSEGFGEILLPQLPDVYPNTNWKTILYLDFFFDHKKALLSAFIVFCEHTPKK